ncbi:hypothetical protein J7K42_01260 [bacterium]|nr:hypothetical protein [bacterium]
MPQSEHEKVVFCSDNKSGLRGDNAVHNATFGLVLGGLRILPYLSEREALNDALRLSPNKTLDKILAMC